MADAHDVPQAAADPPQWPLWIGQPPWIGQPLWNSNNPEPVHANVMAELQAEQLQPLWVIAAAAWGGAADDVNSRLHEILAAAHPILGWRDALEVAEIIYARFMEVCPIHGPQRQRMERTLDLWTRDVHRTASLEWCVRRLTQAMQPFLRAWWTACLGAFNPYAPQQTYRKACVRGATLKHYYDHPHFPHVVIPDQGAATVLHPTHYGAGLGGAWENATRPPGLPNLLWQLNECERRFVFGIVYMSLTDGWEARYERMISVLTAIVRLRIETGLDTMQPAVMGMQWDLSWVTSGMLRTPGGQQLMAFPVE